MVEKLKEVSSVTTTNDYVELISVKVLPQTSQLLVFLKEENTNAVLYKIEGAQDENFADPEVLKAESTLAKDDTASVPLSESWLFIRVLHKAASEGVQGKTSCIISGSGGVGTEENLVPVADSADNVRVRDVQGNKGDAAVTVPGTTKSVMAYVKGILNLLATLTFQHQADALLSQAAPVQNTWYTVLDTVLNCRLIQFVYAVADTSETIQTRITIDGNVLLAGGAATAATVYTVCPSVSTTTGQELNILATSATIQCRPFLLEGRSIKIEVRKTTAAGTGTLTAKAVYAKR